MQKITALVKWSLITTAVIVISVVVFFTFLCKNCLVSEQENTSSQKNLDPPADITTEYNPYLTAPIFKVTGEDNGSTPYSLELVWPETFKQFNDEWIPVLNCTDNDYLLHNQKDNTEEKVPKEEFLSYLESDIPEGTMITGLCSDIDCYELTKNCILYTYK